MVEGDEGRGCCLALVPRAGPAASGRRCSGTVTASYPLAAQGTVSRPRRGSARFLLSCCEEDREAMAPRAWLIENPTAGQSDWTTEIQSAGATFREAGWEVLQRPTEEAGDATEFAREAVSQVDLALRSSPQQHPDAVRRSLCSTGGNAARRATRRNRCPGAAH